MTISTRVKAQLFATTPTNREQLIRLPPTSAKQGGVVVARYVPSMASSLSPSVAQKVIKTWTQQEHDLFLQGLERYPHGPWKKIADFIGTKTARQTMAHAQKYRQKIARRQLIWKTAAAALNNSVAAAAAVAAAQHHHHMQQMQAPSLLASQHNFLGMYHRSSLDFGSMSLHGSSASTTPDTSDDESWASASDFSAGQPHLGSGDFSSHLLQQSSPSPSSATATATATATVQCEQGHVCADASHCDNCFFEREILPMLVKLDTTGLDDL